MRALVTGACGFIGSHFLRYFVEQHPDWEFVVLDRLSYAASLDRIRGVNGKIDDRIKFVFHDLRAFPSDYIRYCIGAVDYVFHLAAETHVDRSVTDPEVFVQSNVIGTFNLLEYCRRYQPTLKMFFLVSTDEVFGAAPAGVDHSEDFPHRPSNVYSATKAAAEDIAYAYDHSMGVPVIVTNTMNNIGETQDPEKYLPKILRAILRDETIDVHAKNSTDIGSRKYLHARDHAAALNFLVSFGQRGERYNITGIEEIDNLALLDRVRRVLVELGEARHVRWRFVDFHAARPGHDRRYSLDGRKLAAMGWTPKISIDDAIRDFVAFSLAHPGWLQ